METVSLANHFLIAMPAMADPNFSRTLTYICEHNADGAIGIIVNRPLDMSLGGLFDRVSIPIEDEQAQARCACLPVKPAASPLMMLMSWIHAGDQHIDIE